jgi:arginyl-tRNA synthetase
MDVYVALGAGILVVHIASIASAERESMTEPPSNDDPAPSELLRAGPSPSLQALRGAVLELAEKLAQGSARTATGPPAGGGRGGITLERPPRADFGDYSTNAALLLAPVLGASPREVAERLGNALQQRLGVSLERFEVAGPGFLNLFLSDSWLSGALSEALAAGDRFGAGRAERPERVLVEFVSANPTGPMHVGHARNAAYGDSLARILSFHGDTVSREFYINDAGSQVAKLGETIQALAQGREVPEGGYRGEYVLELVAGLEDPATTDPAELGREAVALMIANIRASLVSFGVEDFDHWAYESTLHQGDPSAVAHTLAILAEQGHTYTSDGALWLRTTEFGDDKDRVLVRSNGEHTYFASDIAYHQDKRERGFERQIDVWGADHHGYVMRMKAAYEALGGDPDELELLIMQLVHLVRSGERAQMSKRAGEFVTLDGLVAEIGVDAARWYLLARSHDTTVDLDLDLARSQSNENPVYYVQYAHARIVSVLAKAGAERVREIEQSAAPGVTASVEREPLHASERELIKQLLAFTVELEGAAERRAPHRIAAYALELAQCFTAFYRDCRVVGAEPETVESARIALCLASRRTIARCLDLLGVGAPQEM